MTGAQSPPEASSERPSVLRRAADLARVGLEIAGQATLLGELVGSRGEQIPLLGAVLRLVRATEAACLLDHHLREVGVVELGAGLDRVGGRGGDEHGAAGAVGVGDAGAGAGRARRAAKHRGGSSHDGLGRCGVAFGGRVGVGSVVVIGCGVVAVSVIVVCRGVVVSVVLGVGFERDRVRGQVGDDTVEVLLRLDAQFLLGAQLRELLLAGRRLLDDRRCGQVAEEVGVVGADQAHRREVLLDLCRQVLVRKDGQFLDELGE